MLDGHLAVHLPRVLPDPSVRHHHVEECGPLLLDARDPGFESRHPDGAGHLSDHHLRHGHAAPGRKQDHRRRPEPEGGPRTLWRCAEALWHAHHDGRGGRVRHERHVRRPAGARRGEFPADHHAALLRGHHRDPPGRADAEGIRHGLRHLALHRHQHLREHRLEGLLPHDHEHGQGHGVRGGGGGVLPLHGLQVRQDAGAQGGLLPAVRAEPHEPLCHRAGLLHRDLLPGLPRGPGGEEPEGAGADGLVPHQALLHLQHSHHPADRPGLQPLLLLTALVQALQVQHACEPGGPVAGGGVLRAVDPRGRPRLLHLPAALLHRHLGRPHPRAFLRGLRPHFLRPLLQDLDRRLGLIRARRCQAAEGPAAHDAGLPRQRPPARPEPLHPHRGGLRRRLHRRPDHRGGLPRGHRQRHGHPPRRDNYLSVL
mmetsp:Transcript_47166/g.145930  ORF Transcript_47166/g.145930 Transcript_47166/m.145930 type:complete len:426 (+) Transcript_47166:171-1448(+)